MLGGEVDQLGLGKDSSRSPLGNEKSEPKGGAFMAPTAPQLSLNPPKFLVLPGGNLVG